MQRHNNSFLAHAHNGLLGSVAMATRAMITVQGSQTTTEEAKKLAAQIQSKLCDLDRELRTHRIFPKQGE